MSYDDLLRDKSARSEVPSCYFVCKLFVAALNFARQTTNHGELAQTMLEILGMILPSRGGEWNSRVITMNYVFISKIELLDI